MSVIAWYSTSAEIWVNFWTGMHACTLNWLQYTLRPWRPEWRSAAPSVARRPAEILQLDTPQASKKSHNSIHNRLLSLQRLRTKESFRLHCLTRGSASGCLTRSSASGSHWGSAPECPDGQTPLWVALQTNYSIRLCPHHLLFPSLPASSWTKTWVC